MSNKRARWEALKNVLFGVPKNAQEIKKTGTVVKGAVEQSYGIYQVPSFRELVTTMWNDSVLREAIQNFAEQVVATGFFLTGNGDYTVKLPVFEDNVKVGEFTAVEAINYWCERNNIEEKLLEIAIELRAFGNSLWRISDNGFSKIPIEAVWHAVRIDPDIPLQEKYNVQLVPIYGGVLIPWGEFIHFRIYVTGYKAPFGMGLLHSLLARPVLSDGTTVCPSIYDIRLSMRAALDEGFRKFSFGNELWVFEDLPEEKMKELGDFISGMKSTGNRLATNVRGDIKLAVPQRTQSYDQFVENMRNEFYISLADPTLKLGLEMGYTKATSETAADLYKFKIATIRQSMKHHFENLFVQILDKLGFDGKMANVQMHFEKVESPTYDTKEIFGSVDRGIITRDEARKLLAKYSKWDIQGKIEGGDVPVEKLTPAIQGKMPMTINAAVKEESLEEGVAMVIHEQHKEPRVVVSELSDSLTGFNRSGDIYIDRQALSDGYPKELLIARARLEHDLIMKYGFTVDDVSKIVPTYERELAVKTNINWEMVNKLYPEVLAKIKTRGSKDPDDLIKVNNELLTAKELRDKEYKEKKMELVKQIFENAGENKK